MADAILNELPKDWRPAVTLDWSEGFWDKMKEKYKKLDWIL